MSLRYKLPPSPCTASSHAISVKAFRWRGVSEKITRSDHVTQNALAARNKPTVDSRCVQSFAIIKNTEHKNFFIGRFKLELEMDYPSETNLCTVVPSLHRHFLFDFFWGEGAAVRRLKQINLKRIIWTDKLSVKIDG